MRKVVSFEVELRGETKFKGPLGLQWLEPHINGDKVIVYAIQPHNDLTDDSTRDYFAVVAGGGDVLDLDRADYVGKVTKGSQPLFVFIRRSSYGLDMEPTAR